MKIISLRQAINHKCKECIYDPESPGRWIQQVTVCTCNGCPLYEVRPKSRKPIPEKILSFYGLVKHHDDYIVDKKISDSKVN